MVAKKVAQMADLTVVRTVEPSARPMVARMVLYLGLNWVGLSADPVVAQSVAQLVDLMVVQ